MPLVTGFKKLFVPYATIAISNDDKNYKHFPSSIYFFTYQKSLENVKILPIHLIAFYSNFSPLALTYILSFFNKTIFFIPNKNHCTHNNNKRNQLEDAHIDHSTSDCFPLATLSRTYTQHYIYSTKDCEQK